MDDGDGTVPLISLGFMCNVGWKQKRWNPYNVNIKTVEYFHENLGLIYKGTVRGGIKSGEHLDILGNEQMIKDILLIASGNKHKIKHNIYSNIQQIAKNIVT